MKKSVALILALVLSLSLAACGQNSTPISTKAEIQVPIAAKYDADQIAYIPLMDGNVVKVDDNVFRAAATPDRTHIVVLNMDATLYYTDAAQTAKTQIADKGDALVLIANEGILYEDSEGETHRYLFADGSDVNIGKIKSYECSENGFNIAYAIDSDVYTLLGTSQDKEKIGKITNSCEIMYISDDGQTVYWNDYTENEETSFVSVNGDKSKIGTFETSSKYTGTSVTLNESKKYAVVANIHSDVLFVVPASGEPLKVKLGNELASSTIFTKSGFLSKDTSADFPGIYVSADGSDGNALYYIDTKGEREKVLSKIGSYTILDNSIFYVDNDKNLKTAKISGATLSNEEKIIGDVDILDISSDNGCLYFIKDFYSDDNTGTLYVYKKGADPIKISSDVSCLAFGDFGMINSALSTDNKTIYYYKEPTKIKDTYSSYAVLYKYTYGDSEPTKIASDVSLYSINSGYMTGKINNKSFLYFKYNSVKDEDIIGDWYYFNGTDHSKMATDVIK